MRTLVVVLFAALSVSACGTRTQAPPPEPEIVRAPEEVIRVTPRTGDPR
jgi:hypothetical protein